ncbi:MAG: phosphate/phosphite/phosphonate ABC transporter substrate-binding protein [candidate division WOR-3 bacterium]|nr:phosphate/phosphite/phosphonate ABC transporter substrate-binding protein [candidate division WOR-3 bacterium]MCX7947735.1 phosphate/phosphite/phosphonate ABC transporter substrate-binding protein [candidate division WOR-3 bacterium]MDW8150342.1 phosphate/phosphite/phosphonate ABC transporter substrate-binding protein [candidate division WOR-3 bacterium]
MIFIVLFILTSCKEKEEFIMGYYPSAESEKVVEDLSPLEEYLEKKLNIKIKPFIATDYTSLIEGLCSGKIDGSFLSALPYVISKSKCKTKMIVTSLRKDGTIFYKTYFLVNLNKPYKNLYDLKGKTWGIPDIASTSGYLFPVLRMNELGLNPDKDFKKIQLNTHENVIIAVYNNEIDFGTIYSDARITLKEEYPDIFEKTKVIDSIGPIPNDGFVVSSRVNENLIKGLKEAFLSINSDTNILNRLKKYGWYGVVETNDSIYNLVEKLYFEVLKGK